MNFQVIIVGILLLGALFFLLRRFISPFGKKDAGACDKCEPSGKSSLKGKKKGVHL